MTDNFLFHIAGKAEKNAWVGRKPVFNSEVILLLESTNFRCSPYQHSHYDTVWFYENSLSDFPGWKIIIDEMIRLIANEGTLVVRLTHNYNFTAPALKMFLCGNITISVDIQHEDLKDGIIGVIVFQIVRKHTNIYQNKNWTFGILTNGTKVQSVVKFLESVRTQNEDAEIIITGDTNPEYEKFNIVYNSNIYNNKHPNISKKKNDIINLARNENIMIIHDRYILAERFFQEFDKYGYDFDFITVKQYYETGKEFPSYCYLENSSSNLYWTTPCQENNYSIIHDGQYLNGGLLIFKKTIAQQVPFDNIVFWNQQEDIILSRRMMYNGIIPRINFLSSAITIGITPNYTSSFRISKTSQYYEKNFPVFSKQINVIRKIFYICSGGGFVYQEKQFLFFSKQINKIRKTLFIYKFIRKSIQKLI